MCIFLHCHHSLHCSMAYVLHSVKSFPLFAVMYLLFYVFLHLCATFPGWMISSLLAECCGLMVCVLTVQTFA